jgi:peptidyl-prolyl cis-trans isomerase B (cyclophilin B)
MRLTRKTSASLFSLVLCVVASLGCALSSLAAKGADPVVVMETSKGKIKVDIYESLAPKTAANFIDLVNRGFYNGLSFHRYVPDFCIQGGDPKGDGTGGFIDPKTHQERRIDLETNHNLAAGNAKLRHASKGVLAMARSPEPNSASSQFYFTLAPANSLDGDYAVFGKVKDAESLEVVMNLRKDDKMTKVYVQK